MSLKPLAASYESVSRDIVTMPALCGGELPCELSSSNEHVHTNDQASLRQTPTASPMDEDLVITGIGGRYPDCDHIQEFWDKLVAGVELSSVDDRRWPVGESNSELRFLV